MPGFGPCTAPLDAKWVLVPELVGLACVMFGKRWGRHRQDQDRDTSDQQPRHSRPAVLDSPTCHLITTGVPTGMSLTSLEMSRFFMRMHP